MASCTLVYLTTASEYLETTGRSCAGITRTGRTRTCWLAPSAEGDDGWFSKLISRSRPPRSSHLESSDACEISRFGVCPYQREVGEHGSSASSADAARRSTT